MPLSDYSLVPGAAENDLAGNFSLDGVTIGRTGTVRISNEQMAHLLAPAFKTATPEVLLGDNGLCGSNCPDK